MDGLPFRTGELGRIPRKAKNRLALSLNPPAGAVSGNWENLADELGYSPRVISNIKMRHNESPFHGLLRLWGSDRRQASLARLIYTLREIERKDCVCILLDCLEAVMPHEEFQRMMEEAKGPFSRVQIPDDQVDVWEELDDQDKFGSDLPEVFLSYHPDRLREAQELSKYLDVAGFEVLADFRYQKEIALLGDIEWREQCLKMARKIVVLCSPGYRRACDSTRRFVGKKVKDDDRGVIFDYKYIVTDITRDFVNKRMVLLRTETGPPDDCVPHQFLNYPPVLWKRSKGEDPVKLNYALWDTPQYEKPKVKTRVPRPQPIKETFK